MPEHPLGMRNREYSEGGEEEVLAKEQRRLAGERKTKKKVEKCPNTICRKRKRE